MKRIILTVVLLSLIASCAPSPEKIQQAIEQTQNAIPTSTITVTPKPTNTPKPTSTPKPTQTPKPTSTPTPIPEPVTFEGSGDSVIDYVVNWDGVDLLEITNEGSSNFVVKNYDANAEYLDLLVNEIGHYHGKLLMDVYDGEDTKRLEIKSSGSWSITAFPFSREYFDIFEVPGTYNGVGDSVILLSGVPDVGTFTNEQRTNFVVWVSTRSGRDLIINEIGPYSGTVIIPSDTIIMEVSTDGNWSVEIKGK